MKKQKSITQFTVAADNPVALHEGNSNDRPIAEASSSVNSSNNVFEKPISQIKLTAFLNDYLEKD